MNFHHVTPSFKKKIGFRNFAGLSLFINMKRIEIAKTITGFPRDIFWKAFKLHFPHSTGETNYIRKGCQNQELQLLFASYQIFLMQVWIDFCGDVFPPSPFKERCLCLFLAKNTNAVPSIFCCTLAHPEDKYKIEKKRPSPHYWQNIRKSESVRRKF